MGQRSRGPGRGTTMGLVLAAVLIAELERSDAAGCELGEYPSGTECCPMCAAGYRVFKHCTAISSTTCTPCVAGTYTDHPNGLTQCRPCKLCDQGANLVTAVACTDRKNTVCDCQPGHFCRSLEPEGCELCQPYTVCVPGTMVKERGTYTKDHVCEVCPPGTSSRANMSETCTPWPRLEEQPPSTALPVPAIVAIAVSVLVAAALAVGYVWQRRKRKSTTLPVQESVVEAAVGGWELCRAREGGAASTRITHLSTRN
ncbi:tumor necrosis factor receptor superfamily member 14 isoform X2 [Pithys albifrons albifrons]|uniref:tumor necrosis factor receptor superfamily member 14 isoform X2 n=1 Tax=Pithys albifrons albifrons TaxID=3385563 RepID=UPI003A5CD342